MLGQSAPIRIIHYNDVYNIDVSSREPVGGASRFVTAIRQAIKSHHGENLVLFSGDAFSPAPLTCITHGDEIPPVLNATNIDVACIGNHDLDGGLQVMKQRVSETNFPWLISNVFEKESTKPSTPTACRSPIGGLHETYTVTRAGFKFGFLGLAAHDWLVTLDKVKVDDLIYEDFCETATRLAKQLRDHQNCDFIIALTHMRQPDDDRLAREVDAIDLILGGHDHVLCRKFVNDRWIVKSGTDFKNFSTIDLQITTDGKLIVEQPVHYSVTSEYTEDPETASFVTAKLGLLGNTRQIPLAQSTTVLDGRFISIRSKETGLGNFVCDVMTDHMGARIGLINAGSFRSDSVEPVGKVTHQTIDSILPFKDQVILVRCKGVELLNILENSVSQYPLLDGRFCQVSGVSFSFDAKNRPGQRIDRTSVKCRSDDGSMKELEDAVLYECAMKSYIFSGKDGFAKGDVSNILRTADHHLRDVIVDYLQRLAETSLDLPIISPCVEGRIACHNPDEELWRMYET